MQRVLTVFFFVEMRCDQKATTPVPILPTCEVKWTENLMLFFYFFLAFCSELVLQISSEAASQTSVVGDLRLRVLDPVAKEDLFHELFLFFFFSSV